MRMLTASHAELRVMMMGSPFHHRFIIIDCFVAEKKTPVITHESIEPHMNSIQMTTASFDDQQNLIDAALLAAVVVRALDHGAVAPLVLREGGGRR